MVPLVEQELLTHTEHMRSSPVYSRVRVAWYLAFCAVSLRSLFVPFLLAIVMLAFLWITAFGHCDVCLSLVYGFWSLWCLPFFGLRLLAIVMFAFLWFTAFGHCDVFLLWFTAFGHCDVCLSVVYGFWPLWCLPFFGLRLLAIVMFSFFGLRRLAIVMFVFLWFTAFGHCDVCLSLVYGFWPLWCLPFFGLRLLAIVMFAFLSFTACAHGDVCLSLVYGFLPLWCLPFFGLRFWPLWCLPFLGLRLLAIVMFAFLWFTAFGHCNVCLSLVYGF